MRPSSPSAVRGKTKAVRSCFRMAVLSVIFICLYYMGRPVLWHVQGKIAEWRGSSFSAGELVPEVDDDGSLEDDVDEVQLPRKAFKGSSDKAGDDDKEESEEDAEEETKPVLKEEELPEDEPSVKAPKKKKIKRVPSLKKKPKDAEPEESAAVAAEGDEDTVREEKEPERAEEKEPEKVEEEKEPEKEEKEKEPEKVEEEKEPEKVEDEKVEEAEVETVKEGGSAKEGVADGAKAAVQTDDGPGGRNIIQEGRPLKRVMKQPIWTKPPQGTQFPAKKEFALRREMVDFRAKNNVIVVTFANYAFMDFVLNWVKHLTDLDVTNILIGAMDDKIMEGLFWAGVPVFDMDSHMAVHDVGWGTQIFHKMGREKVTLVNAFLYLGYEILMCDTDMVWLRDPVKYVARFPDADVLTSSDQVTNTVDDETLEVWERAQSAYNIGILHFRPTKASIEFSKEWRRLLESDDNVWDQNGFNDIMRRKMGPAVEGGSTNLFYSFDGTLKLGILPVSIFCSGHTYFVQHMHKRLGLDVFAVHTTFQFAGTEGKRHRLREAMHFHDPPDYYDPPGGLLAYKPDIPEELLNPGHFNLTTHFKLINYQMVQIRNALAIAQTLGRTLVLPELWCHWDRLWFPHPGILEGVIMDQPFLCPADHVFEIFQMVKSLDEAEYGRDIPIREYSLLNNPRFPKKINSKKMNIKLCGKSSDDCGKETSPNIYKLHKNLTSDEIVSVLKPYEEAKLLMFSSMTNAFGGFIDPVVNTRFRRRVNPYTGIWCCVQANPGHIWYDMFWYEKPDWQPRPPIPGHDGRPQNGV